MKGFVRRKDSERHPKLKIAGCTPGSVAVLILDLFNLISGSFPLYFFFSISVDSHLSWCFRACGSHCLFSWEHPWFRSDSKVNSLLSDQDKGTQSNDYLMIMQCAFEIGGETGFIEKNHHSLKRCSFPIELAKSALNLGSTWGATMMRTMIFLKGQKKGTLELKEKSYKYISRCNQLWGRI